MLVLSNRRPYKKADMKNEISRTELDVLRREYPAGTRVELLKMDDLYNPPPTGMKGTVLSVDDIGTIHVRWDNGSCLGVVYGEDRCVVIKEEN